MKEILDDLLRWQAEGRRVALARVVDVEGSGPRLPGAAMAVDEAGEVIGSVSGGCVEGAVVGEALALLAANGEGRLVTFGYSDDDAFAVGLTCGGTIHLFLEELDWWDLFTPLASALRAGDPVALVTVVDGPDRHGAKLLVMPDAEPVGSLGDDDLDRVCARDAAAELDAGQSGLRHYGLANDRQVFIEAFVPPPRMFVFGAVDFTAALVRVAKVLGYAVTVCDAREAFATTRRFPQADEVVVEWPHRLLERITPPLTPRDAVCVLTHDHKFDIPAIVAAVNTDVGYIGAMGSRRTHAERVERLVEAGVDADGLARVHGPIGLDIGARSPEETAISICAEIIASRTGPEGRVVQSLRATAGPIHAR